MHLIRYCDESNTAKIHWPLIQGLCKTVGYGGRIDNKQDFDKLIQLIKEYFDEKILTSKWTPVHLNVSFPNSNHLEDYVKIVEQLPDSDSPQIYGIQAFFEFFSIRRQASSQK